MPACRNWPKRRDRGRASYKDIHPSRGRNLGARGPVRHFRRRIEWELSRIVVTRGLVQLAPTWLLAFLTRLRPQACPRSSPPLLNSGHHSGLRVAIRWLICLSKSSFRGMKPLLIGNWIKTCPLKLRWSRVCQLGVQGLELLEAMTRWI